MSTPPAPAVARHEVLAPDRTKFSDRRPVSTHEDGAPGFHLAEDRPGIVPQLPLSDDASLHGWTP